MTSDVTLKKQAGKVPPHCPCLLLPLLADVFACAETPSTKEHRQNYVNSEIWFCTTT